MTTPGYLRHPHIMGKFITFTADDDVWLAPAAGGRAWRLSADRANVAGPRFSPDGSQIAWTSQRDGPPEVYLAPVEGGQPARVSYWSHPSTKLRCWTPTGQIVAITAAGQPFSERTWAYAVGVRDGAGIFAEQRRLPFGPVFDLALTSATTALLTGAFGQDPAFWKRYRGGTAGRLWLTQPGWDLAGTHDRPPFRRLLADLPSQFSSLMLAGNRLAFISDHEGIGNVYSCGLDGGDLRRHTDHAEFYARNASTDGTRIIYQCAGNLWVLPSLDPAAEPERLSITLGSPVIGRAPRPISAADHLDALSCDHTGQASAVQVRGTVHWLTHRDGPARALSAIPGPTARTPRTLGRTGQVAWVIETEAGDALQVAAADGATGDPRRTLAAGQIGWVADLAAAPDGRTVAVAARDGRLLAVDVASGDVTQIAVSDDGPVNGLAFSPDSAWLAWSHPGPEPLRRLRMVSLGDPGTAIVDLTDGRFADTDPAFTADGRYLAFLSRRNFDPVYDAHVFDLAFPYGTRPFLFTLAASTPSPFGPLIGGRPVKTADQPAGANASPGAGEPPTAGAASSPESAPAGDPGAQAREASVQPVRVDLDGLQERIVQVPVPEARYDSLHTAEGGLAWLKVPLTGNLGQGGARPGDDHPRPSLEYFDLNRVRTTELCGQVDWFTVSGDGARLVLRDKDQLLVVPANRKADPDNADDRVSVDLSRARFRADPAALWRASYDQAARIMRHEFWIEDMGGVDWDAVVGQYRPLLGRIATAGDFADLVHELVAELGSSHAYVRPAGQPDADRSPDAIGLLGADLLPGPDGWRIARIVPGESSDPRALSPLSAPGAGISPGDLLLAVDGQPVDPVTGPAPLLAGAAGKPVELTVAARPGGSARRAVVVPLRDDQRLRYQDWVAGRRLLVRELSHGQLGYLHVPDMVSEGWSDFHRDLRGEMRRPGLIIDVRSNRGGHTSQLVIEKLVRKVIGWDLPRRMSAESYPADAPLGPVVALADEFAGSDGDIVTAAIRSLGIGPVVGARTWGGVIGIDGWHELVDGTMITVPKYAFWFSQSGWGVENYGVDPDIEVLISPDDWAADRDVQLQRAVDVALSALAERPALVPPDLANRPSRRRPVLPPRSRHADG